MELDLKKYLLSLYVEFKDQFIKVKIKVKIFEISICFKNVLTFVNICFDYTIVTV